MEKKDVKNECVNFSLCCFHEQDTVVVLENRKENYLLKKNTEMQIGNEDRSMRKMPKELKISDRSVESLQMTYSSEFLSSIKPKT